MCGKVLIARSAGREFVRWIDYGLMAKMRSTKRYGHFLSLMLCGAVLLPFTGGARAATPMIGSAKRVLFLGDSITYAGQYVEFVEAYFATRFPNRHIEFLNAGLPSETVSGLSERGHAGGKFPRPDLHERLGRVLEKMKPDVVIACYGMNDGIYLPHAEARTRR